MSSTHLPSHSLALNHLQTARVVPILCLPIKSASSFSSAVEDSSSSIVNYLGQLSQNSSELPSSQSNPIDVDNLSPNSKSKAKRKRRVCFS